MQLSVVIVNWNSRDDLSACLRSLECQTNKNFEVIVVDNGSTDESDQMVSTQFPNVKLLRQGENLGFAEGCNRGIEASRGQWACMLNNDTTVGRTWVQTLEEAIGSAGDRCGMLQCRLVYMDRPDAINSTGIELRAHGSGTDRGDGKSVSAFDDPTEIFCPTAGAAAYRRSMLEEIRTVDGYFDRRYFMYCEDMDLGWRARLAGWTAHYVPQAVVLHRYHGSSDRHGRTWLVLMAKTNRMRTLVKNASLPFLLRSGPETLLDIGRVAWTGRVGGLWSFGKGTYEALLARKHVDQVRRVSRSSVEQRWIRLR